MTWNQAIDMSGMKIGYWTVIERCDPPDTVRGLTKKQAFWWCRCRCGTEKAVHGNTMRRGDSKSCGCYGFKKNSRHSNIKTRYPKHHELRNDPFYQHWNHMMIKCYQPKTKHYKNYGGIGITVCNNWRRAPNFILWAKTIGFKKNYSLSLKNGATVFSPETVEWINKADQISRKKRERNKTLDLTGQRFKHLTVLHKEDYRTPGGTRRNGYRCECVCGTQRLTVARDLLDGKTTSCGCQGAISKWARNYTHCTKCGKNDSRHAAKGVCFRCYQIERKINQ